MDINAKRHFFDRPGKARATWAAVLYVIAVALGIALLSSSEATRGLLQSSAAIMLESQGALVAAPSEAAGGSVRMGAAPAPPKEMASATTTRQ